MGDRLYKKKGGTVWYGSYYGADGNRVCVCTKQQDRNAARAVLRQLEREAHAAPGTPEAKGEAGQTVEAAVQHLLDVGCVDVAPDTADMYAQKGGHLLRLLGPIDVGKLTLDDVQEYVQRRIDEGAHRETVRKELVTLRKALTIAYHRKVLRTDPRELIPRLRVRYVPKDRYLDEAEFSELLLQFPFRRRLWLLVAVYTGGRASEVEGISWEHLDLARKRVLVPGTKTHKARRWVPIPEPLHAALESIAVAERQGSVVEPWSNVRRDLFEAVERINAARAEAARWSKEKDIVLMRRVSPNDLRRTYASWLKQRGVDSMIVAKLLGHTTSRMVELVYGHLNDAAMQDACSLLPSVGRTPLKSGTVEPPAVVVALHEPVAPRPPRKKKEASAAAGSKWVAEPARLERQERTGEPANDQSSSDLRVPSPGIEPGTRGFSVRCSTS